MTKSPWFNSGSRRLTVSFGRGFQGGEKLDLSIFWLYCLLWVPPLVFGVIFHDYLASPSAQYYGAWLFTYLPALPGFYILQREYRPALAQFGMTRRDLRARRVWIWASVAVFVVVLWLGFLYWGAGSSGPVVPSGNSRGQGLLSCSHIVFATFFGVLIVPAIEEFVFRGYLYLLLRQNMGLRYATLVASAAFGVVHGLNAPAAVVLSLIWIYLDNQAGSLCPSLIGHAAWNGALLFRCGHAI